MTGRWGLMMIATCLCSGAIVASASAQAPELGRCVKVAPGEGSYNNSGCTEEGGGRGYEWKAGPRAGAAFSIRLGAAFLGEGPAHSNHLACTAGTGSGTYAGPKSLARVTIAWSGCEGTEGEITGLPCTTEGEPERTIRTKLLSGSIGVAKKGETPLKDKLGIDLSPAPAPTPVFVEFVCAAVLHFAIKGSAIGIVTPTNKMSSTYTLKFELKKGEQYPERLEGGERDVLEGWGLSVIQTEVNEEKLEINTVV